MSQDTPKTIHIKAPIWAPRKFFNYSGQEPFIGVAEDKVEGSSVVNIELGYLKERPVLRDIQVEPFLKFSKARNWVNQKGGHTVCYAPFSDLKRFQVDFRLAGDTTQKWGHIGGLRGPLIMPLRAERTITLQRVTWRSRKLIRLKSKTDRESWQREPTAHADDSMLSGITNQPAIQKPSVASTSLVMPH